MKLEQLSETDYDNLVWAAFERVAEDAPRAHSRLDSIRAGNANSVGLSANDILKRYRSTLEAALLAVNAAIEEE